MPKQHPRRNLQQRKRRRMRLELTRKIEKQQHAARLKRVQW